MSHGHRAPGADPIIDPHGKDPRSAYLCRFGSNVRDHRLERGLSVEDLACTSAPEGKVGNGHRLELGRVEPSVLRTVATAAALETDIDELTAGLYWNPGEVATRRRDRRSGPERIRGHLTVVPPGLPAFEEPSETESVRERGQVAAVVGRNLQEARLRRHLSQADLGLGDKNGASLIERGAREPRLEVMATLARRLELPLDFLFRGMTWDPPPALMEVAPPRTAGSRFDHRSLDEDVTSLWQEGLTAAEIGRRLGASGGSIEKVVKRLRAEGRDLPGRRGRGNPSRGDRGVGYGVERAYPAPPGASDGELRAQLAENLRRLRTAAGLSIRQLAEAAELNYTHLANCESGNHDPRLGSALRLAGSLNRPLSALVAGISWNADQRRFALGPPEESVPVAARLGANVKRLRRATGLSQRSIAAAIGMNRPQFGEVERGLVVPTPLTVVSVAYGLGTVPSALLAGVRDWHIRPLPDPEFAPGEEPLPVERRRRRIIRLWAEGVGRGEIADSLGITAARVASMIDEMRDEGIAVPYRHPPRSVERLQTRLRRHRTVPSAD